MFAISEQVMLEALKDQEDATKQTGGELFAESSSVRTPFESAGCENFSICRSCTFMFKNTLFE